MGLLRPAGMRRPSGSAGAGPVRAAPRVRRYGANAAGRDFVVGDLHGCYDLVVEALRRVSFDPAVDRLFSLGDTVDRGPDSHRALGFLSQPWVHAIRGNHEDMFLQLYASGTPHEAAVEFVTSRNGMAWWRNYPESSRAALLRRFAALPVVIEIETRRGLVGLVHAEVPSGMDWPDFIARVEAGEEKVVHDALWGRDRIGRDVEAGVRGVDRVFVGHTPIARPRRLGNVFYVDTGAVFGVLSDQPWNGRLTLSDITAATLAFEEGVGTGLVDLRISDPPQERPFGRHAR